MFKRVFLILLPVFLLLSACAPAIATPIRPIGYGKNIPGQPNFPPLETYWVVDNGCHFSQSALDYAYKTFDALNSDHIAQVAVVCQSGIKGGYSEATTWISEWFNNVGLGSMIDQRAVAVLIRPDVKPEDYRIIIDHNDAFYWWTPTDEYPIKHEAADYANFNRFDECLVSLARNINLFMRAKWKVYGPTHTP